MNRTGVTLVELIITLAVAAVLLAVAVPSFTTVVKNNRLVANTNEVVSSINLARSEAVRRGSIITLCGSSDQASCNSTDWETGWLLFADEDGDATVDGADTVIQNHPRLEEVTISATLFDDGGHIQYMPTGFIRSEDDGTFVVCDDRGAAEARAINLNVTGRPTLGNDTDNDGVVEDVASPPANVGC